MFLTRTTQDPHVKAEILKVWESKKRNRIEICNQYWNKKIISTKKAIAKDKEYIKKHNKTRFKSHPTIQPSATPPSPVVPAIEGQVMAPQVSSGSTQVIPETQDTGTLDELVESNENRQVLSLPSDIVPEEVEPLVADTFDEFEEDELDDISDDEFGDDTASEVLFSEETMGRVEGMANNFASGYEENF